MSEKSICDRSLPEVLTSHIDNIKTIQVFFNSEPFNPNSMSRNSYNLLRRLSFLEAFEFAPKMEEWNDGLQLRAGGQNPFFHCSIIRG
jgi:hypothetical protein